MATIVKRGNKYSVVYNYTDEDGTIRQKWELPVPTKKKHKSAKMRSNMKWPPALLSFHPQ